MSKLSTSLSLLHITLKLATGAELCLNEPFVCAPNAINLKWNSP